MSYEEMQQLCSYKKIKTSHEMKDGLMAAVYSIKDGLYIHEGRISEAAKISLK